VRFQPARGVADRRTHEPLVSRVALFINWPKGTVV
jgi:hypothetical protein